MFKRTISASIARTTSTSGRFGSQEELSKCLPTSHSIIYDSDKADARLIGIEYIVSEKVLWESM
jgi:hypothetical protein